MSVSTSGRARLRKFFPVLAVLMAGTALGVASTRAQVIPSDASPSCTVSPGVFATWFHSGAPTQNGVVDPADSVTFPNVPNCSFYQWSERMFLWATSPAPSTYGGGSRIFDSPTFYDVTPPDSSGHRHFVGHTPGLIHVMGVRVAQLGPHGLPVIIDKTGRMLEIEQPRLSPAGKPLVLNGQGQLVEVGKAQIVNGRAVFFDAAGRRVLNMRPALRTVLPQAAQPTLAPGAAKPLASEAAKPLVASQALRGVTAAQIRQVPSATLADQPRPPSIVQRFIINGHPIFILPDGTPAPVEQEQAFGEVLQSQAGSLVYYATMVNDVFAYFLTGAKDGGITPTPASFPTTAADLNKVVTFAAAHGRTFPDADALAIEVKTAWVEASTLSNPGDYITIQGTVPTYDKSNPNHWVQNGQTTTTLALVGMHVVGSTSGHPEMIWATFEHFGNAPSEAYSYIDNTNHTKLVAKDTSGSWLFFHTGSTATPNQAHMTFDSGTHAIDSVSPFTISPSDTVREKSWGGASDQRPNPAVTTSAQSNTEIIAINNSVRGQLVGSDIRKNYFMTGSTWTILGQAPAGSFPSGNVVGTSKLANTTMETYQQGATPSFASGGMNCLDCHATNTTNVSHVYSALQPLF